MNNLIRRISRTIAVMALPVLGAGLLSISPAFADSPPNPPARFAGSVSVNGAPAAPGTTIEARVGSTTCGVTTVFNSGSEARYVVDSPALDPGANPNCGTDGAAVTFMIGGVPAAETGVWKIYQLNVLNLTAGAATTATPAASPTATRTPGAPVTGSGVDAGGASQFELPLILMAGMALIGASVVIASRQRR